MARRTRANGPDLTQSWASDEYAPKEEVTEGSDVSFDSDVEERTPAESMHSNGSRRISASRKLPDISKSARLSSSKQLPNGATPQLRRASRETTPRTRQAAESGNLSRSSMAPELIMPSMHEDQQEDSWMDAPDPDQTPRPPKKGLRASAMRESPAARAQRTSSASNMLPGRSPPPLRTTRRAPKQIGRSTDSEEAPSSDWVQQLWANVLQPTLTYLFSVMAGAIEHLKPVLSLILAVAVGIAGIVLLTSTFRSAVNTALAPVCHLPFASHLPFCPSVQASTARGPVEFDQLMNVQSSFEDILDSAATGASLPLDMKRSEASIRDLKHVVRFSHLKSRNELDFELTGFVDTARQASADLTRFGSRVGRAVDHVININHWTIQVVDGIASSESSRGAVAKVLSSWSILPAPLSARDKLVTQYMQHMSKVEEEIATLIVEAQALLGILQNLDDRLDVIAGIAVRDGMSLKENRDELFAQLWTKLGGNRSSVSKMNDQMDLLKQVSQYRRQAWGHVTVTMQKLQDIAHGLEDLRERVSAPETVGVRDDAPLQLHIQNIQSGVERLEVIRQESRYIEGNIYRKVFDRGAGPPEVEGGTKKMAIDV